MHGIRSPKRHKAFRYLERRGWYMYKPRGHRTPIMLPEPDTSPAWVHKTEAVVGDTVYLQHDNVIRSFILSSLPDLEQNGKVSIGSPIGRALLGRHQGDVVHLPTLEGQFDYTILKII